MSQGEPSKNTANQSTAGSALGNNAPPASAAGARPTSGDVPRVLSAWLPIFERIAVGALSLVIVLGAFVVTTPSISPGKKKILRAAQRAFSEDRHTDAERLANEYLRDHPDSTEALIIAGESAKKLRANQRAIDSSPVAQMPHSSGDEKPLAG